MYDFFKNIADTNSWGFNYSPDDYRNLFQDCEAGKIYLFVDPITTDTIFSDVGNETITYSGKFFLVLSSDVDEEYLDKYNDYIKPLISGAGGILKTELACTNYQINQWKQLEVINILDENMDGLMITYNITLID